MLPPRRRVVLPPRPPPYSDRAIPYGLAIHSPTRRAAFLSLMGPGR